MMKMKQIKVVGLLKCIRLMQIDGDGNGTIDLKEIGKALELVGIKVPGYELRDMISSADSRECDDVIDIEEFKEVRTFITLKNQLGPLLN